MNERAIWRRAAGVIAMAAGMTMAGAGAVAAEKVSYYPIELRDHLGNNRMDLTESGAITQIVDYYPFGLPMGCSYHPAAQRRLFGGKELDRSAGLNLYDQEARLYDPATGRFTRPDPLSHDYTSVSHYSFCLNNPLTEMQLLH